LLGGGSSERRAAGKRRAAGLADPRRETEAGQRPARVEPPDLGRAAAEGVPILASLGGGSSERRAAGLTDPRREMEAGAAPCMRRAPGSWPGSGRGRERRGSEGWRLERGRAAGRRRQIAAADPVPMVAERRGTAIRIGRRTAGWGGDGGGGGFFETASRWGQR
jgi:hypothetical protein